MNDIGNTVNLAGLLKKKPSKYTQILAGEKENTRTLHSTPTHNGTEQRAQTIDIRQWRAQPKRNADGHQSEVLLRTQQAGRGGGTREGGVDPLSK